MVQAREFLRRRLRHAPAAVIAAGFLLAMPEAAIADGWIYKQSRAGFGVAGNLDTIWFSCEGPGRTSLVFGAFDGLQADIGYTVVVSVGGTAFLQATRRSGDDAGGGAVLVRTAPSAEFAALIDALKTGDSAEISGPKGRSSVPLNGSGKALTAFSEICG